MKKKHLRVIAAVRAFQLDDAVRQLRKVERRLGELEALITEWADAEDAYFDIATDAERERIKRLGAAEDALRKAVGQ